MNSLIVNGMEVVVVFVGFDASKIPSSVCGYRALSARDLKEAALILREVDGGILVVRDLVGVEDFKAEVGKPVVFLRPKKIVVGIGARRDVTANEIVEAIKKVLEMAGIPLLLVDSMATIDIKRGSKSIIEAASSLGLPLHYVRREEMKSFRHDNLSPDSEIVRRKIGLGGVCESAALIVAGGRDAKLLMRKVKIGRITLALAEEG
ncbi:MAG: cobalamin biosynthesis protein [Candidatus Nezhaarchaeales archaeon]